jgi:acetolactate synthase-1/2/3 large subunit
MAMTLAPFPEIHSPTRRATGARLVVEALDAQGVEFVFGYPGGAIMPVYDALTQARFKHILVRHEQAAAFAADAYARVTGKAGVCLATSGPGATNLVTGIANAMMDSVPLIAITGNVASPMMGTDAFQEIDILGVTLPIVKHSWIVRDGADIPELFAEAFYIATTGRPGPVLIDLPKDVQIAEVEIVLSRARTARTTSTPTRIDPGQLRRAETAIAHAQRPLLYVGGGVRIANAIEDVRAFARERIPSVCTLQGLGVLDTETHGCLACWACTAHAQPTKPCRPATC